MADLTPQQFAGKWERADLKERASYQEHFMDLCRLVFRHTPPPEGRRHPPVKAVAGDFAPRLAALHRALDRAVCDAYGWEHAILDNDEEILRRRLALNLARTHPGEEA